MSLEDKGLDTQLIIAARKTNMTKLPHVVTKTKRGYRYTMERLQPRGWEYRLELNNKKVYVYDKAGAIIKKLDVSKTKPEPIQTKGAKPPKKTPKDLPGLQGAPSSEV